MVLLLSLVALYLVFALVTGFITAYCVLHPETNTLKQEEIELKALGFDVRAFLDEIKTEDCVCSSNGYDIHLSLIRCGQSRKTVLIAHGCEGNRYSSYAYVKMFLNNGFNCVVYDQRNHGENKKSFTSMGFYEERDLRAVLDFVLGISGKQETVGLLGVSMGAATVLMAADKIEKLDFIVSDSAYTSLKEVVLHLLRKYKKPRCYGTLLFCSLGIRLFGHFSMNGAVPESSVEKLPAGLPVLFVHSRCDGTVPYEMFEKLYQLKKGMKSCFVSDKSKHAKMIFDSPSEYEKALTEFLDRSVHKGRKTV